MTARQFTSSPAVRKRVPLLIGIAGPSGSGKTYSALRLASGIQRTAPGEIFVVDTEAGRALHYADQFKFQHVPFEPPFGCFDYLDAIRFCVDKGASCIVVDSASPMHEGEGGTLDQHETAIDRAVGKDASYSQREAANFRCWKQPKADMNRFVECLKQMRINIIFCFRAKEKMKPGKVDGKSALVNQGTMAVADTELIYEMIVQPLLEAGSRGVPNWTPDEKGAKLQTKLPGYFEQILTRKGQPLDESMGELMGKWAAGDEPDKPRAASQTRPDRPAPAKPTGDKPELKTLIASIVAAASQSELEQVMGQIAGLDLPEADRGRLREACRKRKGEL